MGIPLLELKKGKNKMIVKFPVGDWSGDGHGMCDWFRVETNISLDDLRELHMSCKEKLGFEIGYMCRDYEDSVLSEDMIEILECLNINVPIPEFEEYGLEPEQILELWLDILRKLDMNVEFKVIKNVPEPSINFYGFDSKKRHLQTPGYGVHLM